VFATNVTGAMLMAREAAKHFVERKSGSIISIGSTAAVRGRGERHRLPLLRQQDSRCAG
jgi:NAD(P)-dependent dehydrogenase (short-subunit alcohol dehydrogenase family)